MCSRVASIFPQEIKLGRIYSLNTTQELILPSYITPELNSTYLVAKQSEWYSVINSVRFTFWNIFRVKRYMAQLQSSNMEITSFQQNPNKLIINLTIAVTLLYLTSYRAFVYSLVSNDKFWQNINFIFLSILQSLGIH